MVTNATEQLPVVTAFVSYSHVDRKFGQQAKDVLGEVGIDAFLAHEDMETSEQWRERILSELRRCDLFVPLLSKNFLESKWALQEVGFIASRPKVTIAPLSIDETLPFGFMSHIQSSPIRDNGITRELLVEPLLKRVPRKILPGLIRKAGEAGNYRYAEQTMLALAQYFSLFTAEEAQALAEASVSNKQIWSAGMCRIKYLPEFILTQESNLKPETLRALQYQVENDKWYPRGAQVDTSFAPWPPG